MILSGVGVCPGIAAGRVLFAGRGVPTLRAARTPEEERVKLDRAIALARQQLAGSPSRLEWFDDRDLMEFCWELVASGAAAVTAWHKAVSRTADRLSSAPGEPFARRAADVREAGRRVLVLLTTGGEHEAVCRTDAILIARTLGATELAGLDPSFVRGVCTVTDASPAVAEFARANGVPAAGSLDPSVLELSAGTQVVLDGTRGRLIVGTSPGSSLLTKLTRRIIPRL